MYENLICSASRPAFCIVCILYFIHSSKHVVWHLIVVLLFVSLMSNDGRGSFHMLIDLFDSYEVLVQTFWPSFHWTVLLLCCKDFLKNKFWIQVLYWICILYIFPSQSVTCCSVFLTVLFKDKFDKVQFIIFFFYASCFCGLRNLCLTQDHKYFLLCFLLEVL